jgi:hypothetical protein
LKFLKSIHGRSTQLISRIQRGHLQTNGSSPIGFQHTRCADGSWTSEILYPRCHYRSAPDRLHPDGGTDSDNWVARIHWNDRTSSAANGRCFALHKRDLPSTAPLPDRVTSIANVIDCLLQTSWNPTKSAYLIHSITHGYWTANTTGKYDNWFSRLPEYDQGLSTDFKCKSVVNPGLSCLVDQTTSPCSPSAPSRGEHTGSIYLIKFDLAYREGIISQGDHPNLWSEGKILWFIKPIRIIATKVIWLEVRTIAWLKSKQLVGEPTRIN